VRVFYIGRAAKTSSATLSHKYDQVLQTLSAEFIKPQVMLPPSPQFIAIKVQEELGLFFNEVGKMWDT
jgi:hypothetical protein